MPVQPRARLLGLLLLPLAVQCGSESELEWESVVSKLTPSERLARATVIRDAAAEAGFTNGLLLAGIGDAETNLAHCWSEATWACQGPYSATCDGPVLAGSADGPCSAQQGGLGMFQFDAGTYADTLAREGEEVLLIEGNVRRAIAFVLNMLRRSVYVPDFATEEEALAWVNQVPHDAGNSDFEAWINTVAHYYNGCLPSYGCWQQRNEKYRDKTLGLLNEMGADFWRAMPPQPCAPLSAAGGIIEENNTCYRAHGSRQYWYTENAGHEGRLNWTHATAESQPDNYAEWQFDFEAPGEYRVEVYTDGGTFGESEHARYVVTHQDGTSEVVINQRAANGFQVLGDFTFAATGGSLRLDDNTGETFGPNTKTRLMFDAVRVRPADSMIEPPDEQPEPGEPEPGEPEPGEPEPDPSDDKPYYTPDDSTDDTTGCQSATPQGTLFVWSLLFVWLSRKRFTLRS